MARSSTSDSAAGAFLLVGTGDVEAFQRVAADETYRPISDAGNRYESMLS